MLLPISLPIRFSGEAEYQKYLAQLRGFSPDSVDRLAQIKRNEKNEGPRHIALAIWHGVRSQDIDALNREIRRLIKDRKSKDADQAAQSREHLQDLRRAIETALVENGFDTGGRKLDTQG